MGKHLFEKAQHPNITFDWLRTQYHTDQKLKTSLRIYPNV